jgi:hypothetical protein
VRQEQALQLVLAQERVLVREQEQGLLLLFYVF